MKHPLLLIVDDSRTSRTLMRALVSQQKPEWRIAEASSGEEALDMIAREPPDFVTMDVNMSGMSGLQAAGNIRLKYPNIRIVLCTANRTACVRLRKKRESSSFPSQSRLRSSHRRLHIFRNEPMQFCEIQLDALAEIFNIGVGRAAASLSQIVQDEVLLSAPEIRIISAAQTKQMLENHEMPRLSSVSQLFSGPFEANALLIFPESKALEIVGLMLGQHVTPEELAEFEQETLCEIGNIILNACISALADSFDLEFHSALPVHRFGDFHSLPLYQAIHEDVAILLVQVDLIISQRQIQGHILFLMSVDSLDRLAECVDRYLAKNNLL
ncbi:MAG: response regulator [Methylophilaceae bacterium]|nr:response regulator [Methylophilaceae bacterium]